MKESILPLQLDAVVFEVAGQRLLDGLSARVEAEGRTFILGPNGSGKSLTLRIAHGLLSPTSGRVVWGEASPERARCRQAMVFERPVLLRRSALANVEYALCLGGVARAERCDRAREALARTGLEALADRNARVLSAGEQQRLALARAWALEPDVLLLDEPTAALDPSATRMVESIIVSFADSGTKVIMTSHDLSQARRLADEVLFLVRGVLVEQAPAERFFHDPVTPAAKAFLKGELLW